MKVNASFALALSGGSALGAYQGGVYEALHEAELLPDWITGASIGAANGALIAGNAPEDRLARLHEFWRPGVAGSDPGPIDDWRRSGAVVTALLGGRPDFFGLRNPLFPSLPFGNPEPPSLFDTTPLGTTLARLVDFDLLARATPRFTASAVDLESGEDVAFDTSHTRLGPDHIRASGALLPAFPPVEIDGRLLGDAGIAANLPIDPLLAEPPAGPLLILAVDLLPLAAPRPTTLTAVASRLQDLNFATQSRRTISGWQRLFDSRLKAQPADVPAVTLIHLSYADQGREVVGKAFDFSPATVRDRWDKGARDARLVIEMLESGQIEVSERPGMRVHHVAPAG